MQVFLQADVWPFQGWRTVHSARQPGYALGEPKLDQAAIDGVITVLFLLAASKAGTPRGEVRPSAV